MARSPVEHGLEFLLSFDGRSHWLAEGYRLTFRVKRVTPTPDRPHGLAYAFTLHGPIGTRLLGFDNAHTVPAKGSRFKRRPVTADHWHRTESDPGRPYAFKDADTLLEDFFGEVRRILSEHGIPDTVVDVAEEGK